MATPIVGPNNWLIMDDVVTIIGHNVEGGVIIRKDGQIQRYKVLCRAPLSLEVGESGKIWIPISVAYGIRHQVTRMVKILRTNNNRRIQFCGVLNYLTMKMNGAPDELDHRAPTENSSNCGICKFDWFHRHCRRCP